MHIYRFNPAAGYPVECLNRYLIICKYFYSKYFNKQFVVFIAYTQVGDTKTRALIIFFRIVPSLATSIYHDVDGHTPFKNAL